MIITVDESYRHKRDLTEQRLFAVVEQNTPDAIKSPLFPQDEPNAFTFQLDKELIERLNLWEWFGNYAKEAQVSTAGIRGPQNILYPWDTRFPINQIGIVLATLGKSLVANESAGENRLRKSQAARYATTRRNMSNTSPASKPHKEFGRTCRNHLAHCPSGWHLS